MVHRYPDAMKAFYMKRDPDDARVALCVDVLAPEGYGEIIGGGQREDDLGRARAAHRAPQAAPRGLRVVPRPAPLRHVPARRLRPRRRAQRAWLCGLPHVRETIPFPRLMGKIEP